MAWMAEWINEWMSTMLTKQCINAKCENRRERIKQQKLHAINVKAHYEFAHKEQLSTWHLITKSDFINCMTLFFRFYFIFIFILIFCLQIFALWQIHTSTLPLTSKLPAFDKQRGSYFFCLQRQIKEKNQKRSFKSNLHFRSRHNVSTVHAKFCQSWQAQYFCLAQMQMFAIFYFVFQILLRIAIAKFTNYAGSSFKSALTDNCFLHLPWHF